ncbi:MAG: VanZ family protein [Gammaproteobacteria bacterium]|nr:VanZ family protein [Gammaproteobacteria bacterium]
MISLLSKVFRHSDKLAVAWGVAIAYLSLTPLATLPPLPGGDKFQHFAAYALLGLLGLWARRSLVGAVWIAAAMLSYGGIIELLQPYVNRYGELGDFLANGGGVLSGGLAAMALRRTTGLTDNRKNA